MPRVNLGFNVDLNINNKTYCLDMLLGVGQGPATFTIAPHDKQRFNLHDLIKEMGRFLKIAALEECSGWINKVPQPFDKIFTVQIEPEIQVSLNKSEGEGGSPAGIWCILDLYDGDTYGVRLPGPDLPAWLTIEPDFTVYQLMIGYSSGMGLDIKARVEFHNKTSSPRLAGIPAGEESGPEPAGGKKEIISYPFLQAVEKPPLFQICYVGLGQRFGPSANLQAPDPIRAMFDELRANLTSNEPQDVLDKITKYYDPDRGWFIAADIIMQGWRISFVFNDPVLYGLEITCNAKQFKGLLLEVLYQKLGPNLGVYYGALQLPAAMRTIQLAFGSLTIPSFKIWIYTNGDFKVAVGWPLGENSIGIQIYIFTGGGGFYFAKLRSGDNPQNPKPSLPIAGVQDQTPVIPDYNPILAFGLGMWLGLGRSIDEGVLSAEVSLTLQGTFQGIIAWKSPSPGEAASLANPPDYYWFAATVGIVGVLQGKVDFGIISAGILVRLSATAGIAFETDYGTEVIVSASVSVEAYIKIVFIKIYFRFSKSFSFSFTLFSSPLGLACLAGPRNPSFQGIVPAALPRLAPAAPYMEKYLNPDVIERYLAAQNSNIGLDLYFMLQPSALYTASAGTLNGVAMLLVPVPKPEDHKLTMFYQAFAWWLLRTYSSTQASWKPVADALQAIRGEKVKDFNDKLVQFIREEIIFRIHPVDLRQSASEESEMVLFPMFAELQMIYSDSNKTIDFNDCKTPEGYPVAVQRYFEQMSLSGLMSDLPRAVSAKNLSADLTGPSVTEFMFFDYFLMIGRELAGRLAEQQNKIEMYPGIACEDAIPLPDDELTRQVSSLVSRFFWNGLKLPEPGSIVSGEPEKFVMQSAYALTGQQFAVINTTEKVCQATLNIAPDERRLSSRIQLNPTALDGEGEPPKGITSWMPIQNVPPAPAPHWSSQILQMLTGLAGTAEIHIEQMPGVHYRPAWYTVRRPLEWSVPANGQDGKAGHTYFVPLPPELMLQTEKQPLNLTISLQAPADGGDTVALRSGHEAISYTPALLIQFKLGSVFKTQNINVDGQGQPVEQKLTKIYQLFATDEKTREQLELALKPGVLDNATISILYNAGHSGYQSDKLDMQSFPVYIYKTSLSTLNQPESPASLFLKSLARDNEDELGPTIARLDDVSSFLRLFWEVSVVNAPGFFLHYGNARGEGFKDELFTNGMADMAFLVEFDENTPVANIHNFIKISTADVHTGSVFIGATLQNQADNPPLFQYHTVFPSGCIGFTIDWKEQLARLAQTNAETALYSDEYFYQLYHLIQFQVQKTNVPDSPVFKESLWSMALTAASEKAGAAEQNYKQVVPVYKFIDDGKGGEPSFYAAIGGKAKLTMRLMDVFGNHLAGSTYTVGFPVLYNDRIISCNEWPGVTSTYIFTLNNEQSPVLRLKLNFSPQSITSHAVCDLSRGLSLQDDEQSPSLQAALLQYKTICAQLADIHEHITLSSSVFFTNQGIIAREEAIRNILSEAALAFQAELQKKVPAGLERVADFQLDISDIKNQPADLFEVKVWLTFERDESLIDPEALNGHLPEVQKKVQQVQPDLDLSLPAFYEHKGTARAESAPYGTRNFVTQFEKTFTGFDSNKGTLKVWTRSGKSHPADTTDTAFLWALRWSDTHGVSLKVDPDAGVAYFTMAPLCTKLCNQTVTVTPFDPDLEPLPEQTEEFSNIDLDKWAQDFLDVVDKVLNPELAAALAQTDEESYRKLMLHKSYLAKSLTEGLIPVFDLHTSTGAGLVRQDTKQVIGGDLASAKELFEQHLLNQLAKAYAISALVQVPVDVKVSAASSSTDQHPPQFFGSIDELTRTMQPAGSIPGRDEPKGKKTYTVTSSRLALKTAREYLGFLISALRPKTDKELKLDLTFNVSYTEFSFRDKEMEFGYTPSSWLKSAICNDSSGIKVPLGLMAIPIPLREYPESPQLISQEQVRDSARKSLLFKNLRDKPIADALKWDFLSTITRESAGAQDSLWVQLTYNQSVTDTGFFIPRFTSKKISSVPFKGDLESVFEALAQFFVTYKNLEPWLDKLPQILKDKPGQGKEPTAAKLVRILMNEIINVSSQWGAYRRIRDKNGNLIFPVREADIFSLRTAPAEENRIYVIEYSYPELAPSDKPGAGHKQLTVYTDNNADDLPLINNQAGDGLKEVEKGKGPTTDRSWYVTHYNLENPGNNNSDPGCLQLLWKGLEILKRQTANTKFWVIRNGDLAADSSLRTNEKLIYTTEQAKFKNPFIPCVSVEHIRLPEGQPLAASLEQIIMPLLDAGTVLAKNRSLRLALDYRFALSRKTEQLDDSIMSTIPILLIDNVVVKARGAVNEDPGIDLQTLIANLASDIRTWHEATNCSTDHASIFVDVTLFAGSDGVKLPLVILNRIEIPVPTGWWED